MLTGQCAVSEIHSASSSNETAAVSTPIKHGDCIEEEEEEVEGAEPTIKEPAAVRLPYSFFNQIKFLDDPKKNFEYSMKSDKGSERERNVQVIF